MKKGTLTALLVVAQLVGARAVLAQDATAKSGPMTQSQEIAALQADASRRVKGEYVGLAGAFGSEILGFSALQASHHYLDMRLQKISSGATLSSEELERLGAISKVLRNISKGSSLVFLGSLAYLGWNALDEERDRKEISDAKITQAKLIQVDAPEVGMPPVRPSAVALEVR